MPEPQFPFLFFGAAPADFRDGEHLWLVRTRKRLTALGREDLSWALADAERNTRASISRVLFAAEGPWLAMAARTPEPELDEDPDPGRLFPEVAAMLRAAAAVVDVEEVVCTTALYLSQRPWDVWTRAQQPVPSVVPLALALDGAPVVERLDTRFYGAAYHRACASLPPLELRADPAFDAAMRLAHATPIETPEHAPPRDDAHDAAHGAGREPCGPEFALEAVDEPARMEEPPPAALARALPGWTRCRSGRIVALTTDAEGSTIARAIEVLDPGAPAPRRFVPGFSLLGSVTWTPDGARLVASDGERLHVVDLDDFSHRALPSPLPGASAVFAGDRALVLSRTGTLALHRFGPDDPAPVELDRLSAPFHVFERHLGPYLVDLGCDDDEISTLYVVRDDRIHRLGTFHLGGDGEAYLRDGALRIERLDDGSVHRVVGLDEHLG